MADEPTLTVREPSTNGAEHAPTDHTANIGLKGAFLEQRGYQPAQSVIDKFLVLDATPESAWISAGLPLEVGANMRRVIANLHYMLVGVTDVESDVMTALAIWAGHDRLARREAIEVASGFQRAMREVAGQVPSDEIRDRQRDVQGQAPRP